MHLVMLTSLFFLFSPLPKEFSQEPPVLMDLTQLKLEVISTEATNEIEDLVKGARLKAKTDHKLVVVTLKGLVSQSCQISVGPSEFAAIFEHETGKVKIPVVVASSAITVSNNASSILNVWTFDKPDSDVTSNLSFDKPDSIYIKVALVIPEKVDSFFIRYPALAKGIAVIK